MSTTSATYPIVAALGAVERILGPNARWTPVHDVQRRFLAEAFERCRDEIDRIPEIETFAAFTAEEINACLSAKGYSVRLDPWPRGLGFGAVGVMDIAVEWVEKGKSTTVRTAAGRQFPAARLAGRGVQFYAAPDHAHPIARLATRSGEAVYLTVADSPGTADDVEARARALTRGKRPIHDFGGLVFPMVALDVEAELAWLLGMRGEGGRECGLVRQARQQTRLRMNERGARAQSAAAAGLLRGVGPARVSPPDHVIDRPFLVWFQREGLGRPLVAAHVTEDDWRRG